MDQIKMLKIGAAIMHVILFVFGGFISACIPIILPASFTFYFAGANYQEQLMPQSRMLTGILAGQILFFSFVFFYSGWSLLIAGGILTANLIAIAIFYYLGNARAKKNGRPMVNVN